MISGIRTEPRSDSRLGYQIFSQRPSRSLPLNDQAAQLKRVSPRLAVQVCKTPMQYENIQGLHIHPDTY